MSILSKFFQSLKRTKEHEMFRKEYDTPISVPENHSDIPQKLNIDELDFETSPEIRKLRDDFLDTHDLSKLTEKEQEEYEQIIEMSHPSCKMSELAENDIVLYRVGKSCPQVSEMCYEHHEYIPQKENSVIQCLDDTQGLSMTTRESLLKCLMYGDLIVEIPFDKDRLAQEGLLDTEIKSLGGGMSEYRADKVLTGKVMNLAEPKTLKTLMDWADNGTLRHVLSKPSTMGLKWMSVNATLEQFGLYDSLRFLENVQERFAEYDKTENFTDAMVHIRKELDDILAQTPMRIGNEVLENDMQNISFTSSAEPNRDEYEK